jgi:predicted molibdopterin-dependent oxidoreductase YjgC
VTDVATIRIDGRVVQAPAESTILEAAQGAGIDIPTLCHHPALEPEGACRICLVEITNQKALQPACTYPIRDGMEVLTHSPRVMAARRFVLDLLLSDHPLDCLTCERAGSCELQDLAYAYGIKETSFTGERHHYPVSDPNPFIQRDYDKCILCRRCVRACSQINGVEAIGVIWRGFRSKIGVAFDADLQDSPCEFCGMCVEVCPTAALVPKMTLSRGRAWQRRSVKTTCSYCGVGCRLNLQIVDNRIVEVLSDWDGPANHGATCVKGRFGFDYVHHPDRLTQPLIRRDGELQPATWDEALDLVASRLGAIRDESGADAIGILTSAKCTNEENYLVQKLARAVLGTHNVDHCARL